MNLNLSPYPEYTKQTRCNNDLNLESKTDFFRPVLSNVPVPIISNHEHYMCDNNSLQLHHLDLERSSISTRNNVIDSKKSAVQQSFQNDYYTMNFDNKNPLNFNNMNDYNDHYNKQDPKKYLNRNPVNTRRDLLEKTRNTDRQDFMKKQGGVLSDFANFNDLRCENTRKDKVEINSSNYIPMARTMAIPKENI